MAASRFNLGNYSTQLDTSLPSSVGSTKPSNMAGYTNMAGAVIDAFGAYSVGKIQADAQNDINKIRQERLGIQQGLQMWLLNERKADERATAFEQNIDAQVSTLKAEASMQTQLAAQGRSGGTATRFMVQAAAVKERQATAVETEKHNRALQYASQVGQLQLDIAGKTAVRAQQPSGALAGLSATSEILKIGQQIKGG